MRWMSEFGRDHGRDSGLGDVARRGRSAALRRGARCAAWCLLLMLGSACDRELPDEQAAAEPRLGRGSVEVTAELIEVPEGAIFERDLYDYATILKYRVLRVQRGQVDEEIIYVGHYNPWKPRSAAADARVPVVGGDLDEFRAGQRHRMALEPAIDDHYMGGIVNKYFGQSTNNLWWAVWTDAE